MIRVFLESYESAGRFPDGRVKMDIHLKDSRGQSYVWTPDWERLRQVFLEASRVERLNVPTGPERERFQKTADQVSQENRAPRSVNFKLVAMKCGEALKYQTSLNEIDRIAGALFDFPVEEHPNEAITSVRSQRVFDWIMSASEESMNEDKKIDLVRTFLGELGAPEGVQKLLAL